MAVTKRNTKGEELTHSELDGNWDELIALMEGKFKLHDLQLVDGLQPSFQSMLNNNGTRIYLVPKGVVTSGLAAGLKMFGTDYLADQTNYTDFGLWISDLYCHINSKANGTGVLKPIVFSVQDTTYIMRMGPNGNVQIGTMTDGGHRLEVAGGTAKFGGGVVIGSGSTVMSNYQEGAWTPVLAGATTAGAHTYSVRSGQYVRLGRLVFVSCQVNLTAKDATMAGEVRITGLPFVVRNITGSYSAVSYRNWNGITLTSNYTMLTGAVDINTSYIRLFQGGSNQAAAPIDSAAAGVVAITLSATYQT